MNKKLISLVMLVSLLVFGLILAACNTGGGGGGGGSNLYTLTWGLSSSFTPQEIQQGMESSGIKPVASDGRLYTWALLGTGDTATTIYQNTQKNTTDSDWENGAEISGMTFDEIVNFSLEGVSVPSEFKTELNKNKAKAPLAGVFVPVEGKIVFFYISKE